MPRPSPRKSNLQDRDHGRVRARSALCRLCRRASGDRALCRTRVCRFLCPLGAGLALLDRLHLFELLKRRPECGNPCQLCERSCPVKAIEPSGKVVTAECFQCLDCMVEYYDDRRCPPLAKLRKQREQVAGFPPSSIRQAHLCGCRRDPFAAPYLADTRRRLGGAAGRSWAAVDPRPSAAVRWHGEALGAVSAMTLWSVDPARASRALRRMQSEIARMEAIFSLFRPTSELSRLNREGRIERPSRDMVEVLDLSRRIAEASRGGVRPHNSTALGPSRRQQGS